MWSLAHAVAQEGAAGLYYSGYPSWKIPGADPRMLRCHSLRTNIVYALLKYAPDLIRPRSRTLYRWQDRGFDRWVGRRIEACDFIHAMPGQALHTFRAARERGIRTVLNHATGPVRDWVRIMEPEYQRVGMKLENACPYDAEYFAREDEEYALADFHCAASTIVRRQLVSLGIAEDRIWVVPYGAETGSPVFQRAKNPSAPPVFRILFAGQIALRKGVRTLLDALTLANRPTWKMDFLGARLPESARDIEAYRGATPLSFHGPVSQQQLARSMRESSVLVLPSLEEGFGLVVPQALNCGCPCIVSDRVGGGDYVRHRENGSIFPVSDARALCDELLWWEAHPGRTTDNFTWTAPARTLIAKSQGALTS
jgi:glycosyltransferase involved in cell wall biosynthesis